MTLGELKAFLDTLTPEQLARPAMYNGDETSGTVYSTWTLAEPWANYGEGLEPCSSYEAEDDPEDKPWPAGTVFLCVDPPQATDGREGKSDG